MKNIIWDLDGTLIDSQQEVLKALKEAIIDSGFTMTDLKKELRVGPTIDKILQESFNKEQLTEEIKNNIILLFREKYDNSTFSKTTPFPGIDSILSNKKFKHHIITNKPEYPTKRILSKLGWNDFFENILTPYKDGVVKSNKTQLVYRLVNQYPQNDCFIAIGDMADDCKAAKDNNILFIGVLWGVGTKEELVTCNCDYIIQTVDDLQKLLHKII